MLLCQPATSCIHCTNSTIAVKRIILLSKSLLRVRVVDLKKSFKHTQKNGFQIPLL